MTVSTLRPDGTISSIGSPATVGAASAHAALSDDSDSSYVHSPTTGDLVCVSLDDLSLPAGAVITSLAVRGKLGNSGAGSVFHQVALNFQGTMLPFTYKFLTTVTWTTPTIVSIPIWTGGGGGAALPVPPGSDADMDNAALTINVSGDGSVEARVYELYLDVTYVDQPVVSADSPTGTLTTTNLPTVGWSNTVDGDGGPPTFYDVKLFTAAQYGAGGFDPDTSASFDASGITAGAATSWTPTTPLPDGTYRAYVRVAQTVNGSDLWSDWDFTEFTISVVLPNTPSLTVTADDANGRIKLVVVDNGTNPVAAFTDAFELQRSTDGGTTWEAARVLETDDGDGVLQNYARVVAIGSYNDNANATTHDAVLPAPDGGILAGDLLLAIAGMDGSPSFTWPAGWTELKDEAGNGAAVRAGVAYTTAVGGETGTVTVTTSGSQGGGIQILCIRGWNSSSPPEVSTGVSSAAANANPDSLNPAGWGSEHTLWIAAVAFDANLTVLAPPSGYTLLDTNGWADATNGAGISTGYKHSIAASEDPGAFTHAAEDTRAFTIAVRSERPELATYDYEAPNGTTVQYRARALHNYSGLFAASAWVAGSAVWSGADWWLKCPKVPSLNATVVPHSIPSIQRPARQGVFQALGRTDLVVVQDTRGGRRGTLALQTATEADQAILDALLDSGATLLLQAPPGNYFDDKYVRFGDHDRARIIDKAWAELVIDTLAWFEVSSPTGGADAWPA